MNDLAILIGGAFGGPLALALLLSGKWRDPKAWGLAALCLLALVLSFLALFILPSALPTKALQWNWVGKCGSIAVSLVFYACLPAHLKKEVGLFKAPHPPEWRSVYLVSGALLLFFWTLGYVQHDAPKLTLETVLFQGSMPGLDEELAFRGVLLALLAALFGKPWRFAGVQLGWGALPLIAFFGLAHGIGAGAIDVPTMCYTGLMGAGLLWLRERTGSIWVPVLVHNLANVGSQLLGQA